MKKLLVVSFDIAMALTAITLMVLVFISVI